MYFLKIRYARSGRGGKGFLLFFLLSRWLIDTITVFQQIMQHVKTDLLHQTIHARRKWWLKATQCLLSNYYGCIHSYFHQSDACRWYLGLISVLSTKGRHCGRGVSCDNLARLLLIYPRSSWKGSCYEHLLSLFANQHFMLYIKYHKRTSKDIAHLLRSPQGSRNITVWLWI